MAKEEKIECCENKFTFMNGFIFGFGFFTAQLVGLLVIGIIGWLISLVLSLAGITL